MLRLERKTAILLILTCIVLTTSVALAISYVTLTGRMRMDVITPYVRFYQWSDQSNHTQIDIDIDMVASQWTTIDNATYGILNDGDINQDCTFYVESISIETNRPQNLTVQIYNGTAVKCTWTTTTWANLGLGDGVTFTMNPNEKATIRILVLANASPVACEVGFNLRVPKEGV